MYHYFQIVHKFSPAVAPYPCSSVLLTYNNNIFLCFTSSLFPMKDYIHSATDFLVLSLITNIRKKVDYAGSFFWINIAWPIKIKLCIIINCRNGEILLRFLLLYFFHERCKERELIGSNYFLGNNLAMSKIGLIFNLPVPIYLIGILF